jgi:hypothetical protein
MRRNPASTFGALYDAAGPALREWLRSNGAKVHRVVTEDNLPLPSAYTTAVSLLRDAPDMPFDKLERMVATTRTGMVDPETYEPVDAQQVLLSLRKIRPKPYTTRMDMVTVYHATDAKTAAMLRSRGYVPETKGRSRGEYAPGKGLDAGLYVGATPRAVEGYGRVTLAVSVPRDWLVVPTELAQLGQRDPLRALEEHDGAVVFHALPPEAFRPVEEAPAREYRYGALNRPPGYASVPKGYIRVDAAIPGEPRTRHGVVVYDRPLTDEEVRAYELYPYMPLAEVVARVLPTFDEYGQEYADIVRSVGNHGIKSEVGYALDRLAVYTDIPLGEVYAHVAPELARRFPAAAPINEQDRLRVFLSNFYTLRPALARFANVVPVKEKTHAAQSRHPDAANEIVSGKNAIVLYPKFWTHDHDIQASIFAHELGHWVLSGPYGYTTARFIPLAAHEGIDVWDTPSLPFAAVNMEEAFADAFASYYTDKDVLRRYPKWARLVEKVAASGAGVPVSVG